MFKDLFTKRTKDSKNLDKTVHAEDLSIQRGNQYKPKEEKIVKNLSFNEEAQVAYLTGIHQQLEANAPSDTKPTKADDALHRLGSDEYQEGFEVAPSDDISRRRSKHVGRISDDAWEIGLNLKYRNDPVGRVMLTDGGRAIVPPPEKLEKQQKKLLNKDEITSKVQEQHEQERLEQKLPDSDKDQDEPKYLKSILKGSDNGTTGSKSR